MATPKPKHIAVVGNVRLTVLGGTASHRREASGLLLERRPDANSENWYPAAGFRMDDLESIGEAVRSAIQFLRPDSQASEVPPNGEQSPATVSVGEAAAQAPASDALEEPPFEPTGPAKPVPTGLSPARKPTRVPGARPPGRIKPKDTPAKSTRRPNHKSKARTR